MKKEALKKLSKEELEKREKSLKFMSGLLAGVLFVLFVVSLYTSITDKKFDPLLGVALALSATLPVNYSQLKMLRSEIEQR